ncbi:MAG: glutaminase, partial [Bacteroidetes bacterium]
MNYQEILERIYKEVVNSSETGKVADYIPALAEIDSSKFGIAVHTINGETYSIGDADEFFSIQSIAKVFTLTLAKQKFDENVWNRVGKEPSGTPFNSLVQLESNNG